MWNQLSYDTLNYERNLCITYIEAWIIQDFNGIETKRIELWFHQCIKAWDVDKTLKSWTKL